MTNRIDDKRPSVSGRLESGDGGVEGMLCGGSVDPRREKEAMAQGWRGEMAENQSPLGRRWRLLSSSISIHRAVVGRWGRNGRWTLCNILNCLMKLRLKLVASGWECLGSLVCLAFKPPCPQAQRLIGCNEPEQGAFHRVRPISVRKNESQVSEHQPKDPLK